MILAILLFSNMSFAAPLPATSSSALISSKPGLYLSNHGFQIHADNTLWKMRANKKSNILVEYRPQRKKYLIQPALTVRIDNVTQATTLKSYMSIALKEYKRFGFQTLKKKPIKLNSQLAYLVDLYSPASKRQLRQYVFYKDKKSIILTCRSGKKNFANIVKDCNQIARNFTWKLTE